MIRSLVHGGLGVALMREDVAAAGAAAGELTVWPDARLATTLQFIYLKARADEPIVQALRSVIEGLWGVPAQPASAHQAMPSSDQP